MIRKQKLVTVRVATTDTSEVITQVDGKPVEDLLADWRIVGMQSLGPHTGGYTALLLLEELPPENSGGRLGFATEE